MTEFQIRIILEILGRPKEHIIDSLNLLLDKLGSEKGVKILERNVHDAIEVKDANDLYTTFAEVTLEIENLDAYLSIIFAYMPAHVELMYPESVSMNNNQLNQFTNQLVQRLHTYDSIAKQVLADRDILINKMKEVAPDALKELYAAGAKAKEEEKNKQIQKSAEKEKSPGKEKNTKKTKPKKKKN